MVAVIVAALFIALTMFAARRVAAWPLVRTLSISANCWAEGVQQPKEAVSSKTVGLLR
jgi:hypothetical protein